MKKWVKDMKVEFTVTADLDTGTLTVICPEVFEVKNKGWAPEVRTNYPSEYQERLGNLLGSAIRARFMTIAKLTKEELERAENHGEAKK